MLLSIIEYTALHNAAQKGHVYVVKVLIQNSADVNAVQKIKCTALHSAAQGGHVDIAKVLLENGADVNAVQKESWTALTSQLCMDMLTLRNC